METARTIPEPLPAMAEMPPWQNEAGAPVRLRLRRPVPVSRTAEAMHWGVVALTLFTAFSVLLGAFGGHTRPRELLPIMITTAS